jgi:hypothetical protein
VFEFLGVFRSFQEFLEIFRRLKEFHYFDLRFMQKSLILMNFHHADSNLRGLPKVFYDQKRFLCTIKIITYG